MQKYKVQVQEIRQDTANVRTYFLSMPEGLSWDEGAHMHVGLAGFDAQGQTNRSLVHHMSIMTLPSEGRIAFTTRFTEGLSPFKSQLDKLQVKDWLTLFKIKSHMQLRRENKSLIMISMGIADATLRPLIHRFAMDPSCIESLIHLNISSESEFVYRNELEALKVSAYTNYWHETRATFWLQVDNLALNYKAAYYYIVGSDTFLTDVCSRLLANGILAGQIILDKKEELRQAFGLF